MSVVCTLITSKSVHWQIFCKQQSSAYFCMAKLQCQKGVIPMINTTDIEMYDFLFKEW